MQGKWKVKCVNQNNEVSYSADVNLYSDAKTLEWNIMNNCHGLYNMIDVQLENRYKYRENGVSYFIRF
jgi:hypothetical protein